MRVTTEGKPGIVVITIIDEALIRIAAVAVAGVGITLVVAAGVVVARTAATAVAFVAACRSYDSGAEAEGGAGWARKVRLGVWNTQRCVVDTAVPGQPTALKRRALQDPGKHLYFGA